MGSRQGLGWGLYAAAFLTLAGVTPAWAEAEPAPEPKAALPMMLRVLTYDSNFGKRGSGDFVILVASESDQAGARGDFLSLARSLKIAGLRDRPLKFVGGDFNDFGSLRSLAQESRANALMALPGLSKAGLRAMVRVAEEQQIYTLALDPGLVVDGLGVGVSSKDGKPQLVINIKATNAVDAHFETAVLKLARLIQAPGAGGEGATTPPVFLSGPDPEYTQQALDHEVEGTVEAKCTITAQGTVRDCKILKGVPFMDRAVIDALEHRKYTPATAGGKPVDTEYPFKISLKLGQ
jgi:TonB family protein